MASLLRRTVFVAAAIAICARAEAGQNDLRLLNLCNRATLQPGVLTGAASECGFVSRSSDGLITHAQASAEAQAHFRSLMSELGAVLAPRVLAPADGLGFAGFELALEVGLTEIHNDRPYWNAAAGVSPENTSVGRPSSWLTTLGFFARKGVWVGLPAFEVGAGAMQILDSRMLAFQGYAKLALHEGFNKWPLPSLALRAGASYLTGATDFRMLVTSFDVLLSKRIGVRGTFRFEPYAGAGIMNISAAASPIDATPGCDAYALEAANGPPGAGCAESQRGTGNDRAATLIFPKQDSIRRQRYFAGAKLRLGALFFTAQYEYFPRGTTADQSRPSGPRDGSGAQRSGSLSAGLDF